MQEQECADLDPESLIADGQSDDGAAAKPAALREGDPRIKVVENSGCIVSTGLNRAIEALTGDIIVRMDAHTQYPRDCISQCVRVLQATGTTCVAGRPVQFRRVAQMTAAFACMHFGHGLGFAKSILDFSIFLRGYAPEMARLTR